LLHFSAFEISSLNIENFFYLLSQYRYLTEPNKTPSKRRHIKFDTNTVCSFPNDPNSEADKNKHKIK